MTDYFLKKFYKDVAAESWPTIDYYNDFIQLPLVIQQECYDVHNLQHRRDQIESKEYWSRNLGNSTCYKKNNLVYVPTRKCGHSYYVKLLHECHNWSPVNLQDINWSTDTAFGLIMHPFKRRLKGMTECLSMSYNNNFKLILKLLDDTHFQNFLRLITVMDSHTMPYSDAYGSSLQKIKWLPMDWFSREEIKNSISALCEKNDLQIDFSVIDNINVSTVEEIEIFEKLKLIINQEPNGELYYLFANDLKFYHELLDNYQTKTAMDILLA